MNHYIRTIGSMLILVYSMLAAFLFIDKVFVNIIYFQGMFYTQIFGIPVFLFLNLIIILLCIIVGSVLAYKINQQNDWIKTQIERSMEGETVGINDQNIEIYSETLDLYHTLVPLNQELHKLRLKTQNLTNENYNINDVKVKRLLKMNVKDWLENFTILLVSNFCGKYDVICYQRNEVRTTIRPTNSDFRENGSRFAVRNACFAVTFKTAWFKRQIFR